MHHMRTLLLGATLAGVLLVMAARSAAAHQPYFEDDDWTVDAPYTVADPTVSTALYATLDSRQDVDYVTFTGQAGERVLVGLTIPQIEGQAEFAPTLALLGPGLPALALPARIEAPPDVGGIVLTPPPGPARPFFEPFSRTQYWERQEERFTLPADGDYVVAVWHPDGAVGRYTLVVGNREIPGGDVAFPFKLRAFWTPVPEPAADEPAAAPTPTAPQPGRGHRCIPRYSMK
jgi:hypothetical protein